MIEVLPHASCLNRHRQTLVACGNNPHVNRNPAGAPESTNLSIFEDGEQFRLEFPWKKPDLIQEQHASVRGLKEPDFGFASIRESSLFEAEQLCLEQRLRDRGTVDVDEGA